MPGNDGYQIPSFKLSVQLSIKSAYLPFLRYFFKCVSDLTELYNILNAEEHNIPSWQNWIFFKANVITVAPAIPRNSFFVTARNYNSTWLILNSLNKDKLSSHISCIYSTSKILLSTFNYQFNINMLSGFFSQLYYEFILLGVQCDLAWIPLAYIVEDLLRAKLPQCL